MDPTSLNPLTSLLFSVSLHLLMLVAHTHTQMQDTARDVRSHATITHYTEQAANVEMSLSIVWVLKEERRSLSYSTPSFYC